MIYVQVIEDATQKCYLQMEAGSQRAAEKLKSGVMINMNHEKFSCIISTIKKEAVKNG